MNSQNFFNVSDVGFYIMIRDSRSVSPIVGIVLMTLITVILATAIFKISNVYFQPAPNAILDVELYTVDNANATKIVVRDLGGDPIYFKNKRLFVYLNGHRFNFHPFTESGHLMAGDVGVMVVPFPSKVGQTVEVKLAIGGMSLFSGEWATVFYSKKVTVQKSRVLSVENGLLAEWHFEEGENQIKNDPDGDGYSIYDLSGRGINGGFSYGSWSNNYVDGVNGKAIYFDGSNDYVWIHSRFWNKINPRKQVTYEAWIYPEATDSWRYIIANGRWDKGIWIDWGRIRFNLPDVGTLYSSNNIQTNKWYYIVATYDGSKMRIYINGELDNESSASGLIGSSNPNVNTVIGAQSSSAYFFKGIIDEVYIWNRALTPQEIKERFEMYADKVGH